MTAVATWWADGRELTHVKQFTFTDREPWNRLTWIERSLVRELRRRGVRVHDLAHAFGRSRATITAHCRGVHRAHVPKDPVEMKRHYAAKAVTNRALRRSATICINGYSHGPATHGVRCARCHHVHKHGYSKAVELGLIEAKP